MQSRQILPEAGAPVTLAETMSRERLRRWLLLCALGSAGLASNARADVFSYEDKDGVVHFTNVKPAGGKTHQWRVLYKNGPGKAGSVSGAAPPTSFAGCAASRRDVVPATDRSPERYTRYDAHIAEASRLYALPEALIRKIIKTKSE